MKWNGHFALILLVLFVGSGLTTRLDSYALGYFNNFSSLSHQINTSSIPDLSANPPDNYIHKGNSILIANVSNTEFKRTLLAPELFETNYALPLYLNYENIPSNIYKNGDNWSYVGLTEKETRRIFTKNWSSVYFNPTIHPITNTSLFFFHEYWLIENETVPGHNPSLVPKGYAEYGYNSSLAAIGHYDDGGIYNYSNPYETQSFNLDFITGYELGVGAEVIDGAQMYFEYENIMRSNETVTVDDIDKLSYWYSIYHTGNDFPQEFLENFGALGTMVDSSSYNIEDVTSTPDGINYNFRRIIFDKETSNTLTDYDWSNHKYDEYEFNWSVNLGSGAEFREGTDDYGWSFRIQATSALNVTYNTTFSLYDTNKIGTTFNTSEDNDHALTNYSILITNLPVERSLTTQIYTYNTFNNSLGSLLSEFETNVSSVGWKSISLPEPVPISNEGNYCILLSSPSSNATHDIEVAFKNQYQDDPYQANKSAYTLLMQTTELAEKSTGDMVIELIFNESCTPYYNRSFENFRLSEYQVKYNFTETGELINDIESDFPVQENQIIWEPYSVAERPYPYIIQDTANSSPVQFIYPYEFNSLSSEYYLGFSEERQNDTGIDQYEKRALWQHGPTVYSLSEYRDADDETTGYCTYNPTSSLGEIYFHERWTSIYGAENPLENQDAKASIEAKFSVGIGARIVYYEIVTNLSTFLYSEDNLNLSSRHDYIYYKTTLNDSWATDSFTSTSGYTDNSSQNTEDSIYHYTGTKKFYYPLAHDYEYSIDERQVIKEYFINWQGRGKQFTNGNFSWYQKQLASGNYFSARSKVEENNILVSGNQKVTVSNDITGVIGVWTDETKTGENFYTGGTFSGKDISVGTPLPNFTTNFVWVEYYTSNYEGLGFGGNVAFSPMLNATYENWFPMDETNKKIGSSLNVTSSNLGLEAVNISIMEKTGSPPPLRISLYKLDSEYGYGSNQGMPDFSELIQTTTFQPSSAGWYTVNFSRDNIMPLNPGHQYCIIVQSEGSPNSANHYSINFTNALHSNTPKSEYNFYIEDEDGIQLIPTGDLLAKIYMVKKVEIGSIKDWNRYVEPQFINFKIDNVHDDSYDLIDNTYYIGMILNLSMNDYIFLNNFTFYVDSLGGASTLSFYLTDTNSSNLPDMSSILFTSSVGITHTGWTTTNFSSAPIKISKSGNYSILLMGDASNQVGIGIHAVNTGYDLIENKGTGFVLNQTATLAANITLLRDAYKQFSFKNGNDYVEWQLTYNYQKFLSEDVFWNETYSDWDLISLLDPSGAPLSLEGCVNETDYVSLNLTTVINNGMGIYTIILRSPIHELIIEKYRVNATGDALYEFDTLFLGSRIFFTSALINLNITSPNDLSRNGVLNTTIYCPDGEILTGISKGANTSLLLAVEAVGTYQIVSYWYNCYSFGFNITNFTVEKPYLNNITPDNIFMKITGTESIFGAENQKIVNFSNGTYKLNVYNWQDGSSYQEFTNNSDGLDTTILRFSLPKGAFVTELKTYSQITEEELTIWGANLTIGSFVLIEQDQEILDWSSIGYANGKYYRRTQELSVEITPINWNVPYTVRFGASSFTDWYFHSLTSTHVYIDDDSTIDKLNLDETNPDEKPAQTLGDWVEWSLDNPSMVQNISFWFGIYYEDVNSSNGGSLVSQDITNFFDSLLGNVYFDIIYEETSLLTSNCTASVDLEFVNLFNSIKTAQLFAEYEVGGVTINDVFIPLGEYESTTTALGHSLTVDIYNVTYDEKYNVTCLYHPESDLEDYTTILFISESKILDLVSDNTEKMFLINIDTRIISWEIAGLYARSQKITATVIPINMEYAWDLYIGTSNFRDYWGITVDRDSIYVDDDTQHGGSETGKAEQVIGDDEQIYWDSFAPTQIVTLEFYIFVEYGTADVSSLAGQIYINPVGDPVWLFAPDGEVNTTLTVENYYLETANYYVRALAGFGNAVITDDSFTLSAFMSNTFELRLNTIVIETSVNVSAVHIPGWAPLHIPEYDPLYPFFFPSPIVIVTMQQTHHFRLYSNVTEDLFAIEQDHDTISWNNQITYYRSQKYSIDVTPLNIITSWGIRIARTGFTDGYGESPSFIYYDDDAIHDQIIETGDPEVAITTDHKFVKLYSDAAEKKLEFYIFVSKNIDPNTLAGGIYFDVWVDAPIIINSTGWDFGEFNMNIYNLFPDTRTVTILDDSIFGRVNIGPRQVISNPYDIEEINVQFGEFYTDIELNITSVFAKSGVGNAFVVPSITKMFYINVNSSFSPQINLPSIMSNNFAVNFFGTSFYVSNYLTVEFTLSNLNGIIPDSVLVYISFGSYEIIVEYDQVLNRYVAIVPINSMMFGNVEIRVEGYDSQAVYTSNSIFIINLPVFITLLAVICTVFGIAGYAAYQQLIKKTKKKKAVFKKDKFSKVI